MLIGTSLVRGVSRVVNKEGVDAVGYIYPGMDIPYIRSRINTCMPKIKPKHILLQCGGNDLDNGESPPEVERQYQALIDTVKREAPHATITISAIPPRKRLHSLNSKIDQFNLFLQNLSQRLSNVLFVRLCPANESSYKRDMVHFNSVGVQTFGQNIVRHVHFRLQNQNRNR